MWLLHICFIYPFSPSFSSIVLSIIHLLLSISKHLFDKCVFAFCCLKVSFSVKSDIVKKAKTDFMKKRDYS